MAAKLGEATPVRVIHAPGARERLRLSPEEEFHRNTLLVDSAQAFRRRSTTQGTPGRRGFSINYPALSNLQTAADVAGLVLAEAYPAPPRTSWRMDLGIWGNLGTVTLDRNGNPTVHVGAGDEVYVRRVRPSNGTQDEYSGVRGDKELTPEEAQRLLTHYERTAHSNGVWKIQVDSLPIPDTTGPLPLTREHVADENKYR
jgi:hypothetical protein